MIKTSIKFIHFLMILNYHFINIISVWKLKKLKIYNKKIKLFYPKNKRLFTFFILKPKKFLKKSLLKSIKLYKVKYFKTTVILRKITISPYIFIKDPKKRKKSYIIRAAIPYVKTRYSIIRQECKNIVLLVLLLNFFFIYSINSIYLKSQILVNLKWIILIFIILYLKNYLSFLYFNLRDFVFLIFNKK